MPAFDFAQGQFGRALPSFFHSGDGMHRVFLRRVTVQRWADAQKKFEGVTEIFSVVTIEAVRAIIDRHRIAPTLII